MIRCLGIAVQKQGRMFWMSETVGVEILEVGCEIVGALSVEKLTDVS